MTKLKDHYRSMMLNLFGIGTLILSGIFNDDQLLTYSIIFFTGAIITSAVESKK